MTNFFREILNGPLHHRYRPDMFFSITFCESSINLSILYFVSDSITQVLDNVTLAGEDEMPTLVDAVADADAEDFVEDSFVKTVFKDRIHF